MKEPAPFRAIIPPRLTWLAWGAAMALATAMPAQSDGTSTGPKPEMTLSISGEAPGEIFVGEPLAVNVWLSAPDAPAKSPLRVRTAAQLWPEAISLTLLDAQGTPVSIAPRAAGLADSGSLVLSARQRATVTFRWKSGETQTLAPGRYEVRGKFRCRIPPWEEQIVEAEPLALEIKSFPANATPEQSVRHAMALARGLFNEGDLNGARSQIEPYLKTELHHEAALVMHARILEKEGNISGALTEVSRALPEIDPKNPGRKPPLELLEYRRQLVSQLMSGNVSQTSRLPPSTATTPASGNATIASEPAAAPTASPASNKSFSGNWSTKYGTVTLLEENGRITGVYPLRKGRLEGTVVEGVARFEWKSDLGRGRGFFRISDDGNFFRGAYANGADDPEQAKSVTWGGARTKQK